MFTAHLTSGIYELGVEYANAVTATARLDGVALSESLTTIL